MSRVSSVELLQMIWAFMAKEQTSQQDQVNKPELSAPLFPPEINRLLDLNLALKREVIEGYQHFIRQKAKHLSLADAERILSDGLFHDQELSELYPAAALRDQDSLVGKWNVIWQRLFFFELCQRNLPLAEALLKAKINLAHGSKSSILASVYKHGLLSRTELEKQEIAVSTGEWKTVIADFAKVTTTGGYVSLTTFDDSEALAGYSRFDNYQANQTSFPVVFLVSLDEEQQEDCISHVKNKHGVILDSDNKNEVGYPAQIKRENIKIVLVPKRKVPEVQAQFPNWQVFDLETYLGRPESKPSRFLEVSKDFVKRLLGGF